MSKLIESEIRWDDAGKFWRWLDPISGGLYTNVILGEKWPTKREFVKSVAETLKTYVNRARVTFSLSICDKQGRYIEERTYQRSSDSKKSKG